MNVIATSTWAYPVLESVHITGVALLLGSLAVFELRVWGLGRTIDLRGLGRLALPVSVCGFVLAAGSGSLMFASSVDEMLANRVFIVKMGLLGIAGANAIWLHARGGIAAGDRLARAQTALSLGLWLAVLACGRFIAYN